ncbi:MAG: quinolinate synthase NadA [Planctomycetota bacterium]
MPTYTAEKLYELGHLGRTSDERATGEQLMAKIAHLKQEKNAIILAHNYQEPAVLAVADFIGDSFELSRKAKGVTEPLIVFCGVHFMAETAKILNPSKTVLLPNLAAGCSLADSADPDDVEDRIAELKKVYPDLMVATYVNTTAAVKALSDVCVTSSNAAKIVSRLPSQNILFIPDRNLAGYVAKNTRKNVIAWEGNCYVHQEITPEQISFYRKNFPDIAILVHPECRADVQQIADAVLSTSGMVDYAKQSPNKKFLVVTECGLSDRLELEVPEKEFYRSCKLCRFMKATTLEDVASALEKNQYVIDVPEPVRIKAAHALEQMITLAA